MPVKKIAISLVLVLAAFYSEAQYKKETMSKKQERKEARREKINQLMKQEEEGEVVFNKQNVFGIKLITDGYGLSFEHGRYKSNRKTILYQFEFNEKRHPKEKSEAASVSGFQINSVRFGKTNNFYQAKLGVALQQRIGGKGNKNGVAVSGILGGGLSLGLLKPYYVDVENFGRKTYPTIIDSGYTALSAAGIFVGWDQLKFNPGAHAKLAMRFDYGRFNEQVTAIEVGLMTEFYSKNVSQLAYVKEKQFFFSAYISLLLGRRK
jgi:hypothetical protein